MNRTITTIAVIAAATLLLAGALSIAGHASAQEPTPTAPGERHGAFLERVAEKLSLTVEELRAAFKAAALDAVDDALASGRITEDQAARAKDKIESGKGLRKFLQHRQQQHHRRAVLRHAIVESSAAALQMPPEELRDELRNGKSVADVAADAGISLDAVKARVLADADAQLDEAVGDNRISQERADAAYARLDEHLDDLLHRTREAPAPAAQ